MNKESPVRVFIYIGNGIVKEKRTMEKPYERDHAYYNKMAWDKYREHLASLKEFTYIYEGAEPELNSEIKGELVYQMKGIHNFKEDWIDIKQLYYQQAPIKENVRMAVRPATEVEKEQDTTKLSRTDAGNWLYDECEGYRNRAFSFEEVVDKLHEYYVEATIAVNLEKKRLAELNPPLPTPTGEEKDKEIAEEIELLETKIYDLTLERNKADQEIERLKSVALKIFDLDRTQLTEEELKKRFNL